MRFAHKTLGATSPKICIKNHTEISFELNKFLCYNYIHSINEEK
jgi:hypothetical protein